MSESPATRVLIGTSGWSYKDWVGPFYPEGSTPRSYLSRYASEFAVVEIDSTYYSIPAAQTVQGWREHTPEGFLFAPKIPGTVTHGFEPRQKGARPILDRVLRDPEGDLERFLDTVAPLGERLGPVLFQFPYFRVREMAAVDFMERLDQVLSRARASAPKGAFAVELRNKSWIGGEYLDLLRGHQVAPVMLDHPYMPPPSQQLALGLGDSGTCYIRFLGDRYGIEKITKTWEKPVVDKSRRLDAWAENIVNIATRGKTRSLFAFSNNHFAGHAPATCRALVTRLEERGVAVVSALTEG